MSIKNFFVKRRESIRLTFKFKTVIVMVFLVIALLPYKFWLTQLAEILIIKDNLEVSDAIMVLSGGSINRLDYGVRLFKEGYGGVLFLSEGEDAIDGLEEIKWIDLVLPRALESGVAEDKIFIVRNTSSTREEADSSREGFMNQGVKSVIIVTEPYHTLRSCLTFRKTYKDRNIIFRCRPSLGWFRSDNWWTLERGLIAVNNEYIKLVFYLIKGYI